MLWHGDLRTLFRIFCHTLAAFVEFASLAVRTSVRSATPWISLHIPVSFGDIFASEKQNPFVKVFESRSLSINPLAIRKGLSTSDFFARRNLNIKRVIPSGHRHISIARDHHSQSFYLLCSPSFSPSSASAFCRQNVSTENRISLVHSNARLCTWQPT